jgi:hypothetical protein
MSREQDIIDYMREVVSAYVTVYQNIGNKLKDMGDDGEPDSDLEIDIEQCFDTIQPLLTLYEDTKPENIDRTLAQYKLLKSRYFGNNTLN